MFGKIKLSPSEEPSEGLGLAAIVVENEETDRRLATAAKSSAGSSAGAAASLGAFGPAASPPPKLPPKGKIWACWFRWLVDTRQRQATEKSEIRWDSLQQQMISCYHGARIWSPDAPPGTLLFLNQTIQWFSRGRAPNKPASKGRLDPIHSQRLPTDKNLRGHRQGD